MKKLSVLLGLLWLATAASAQTVQQSGNVTPGHAAQWVTTGVIKDAGTAQNGSLTSLGVTNNGGPGICVNSAPVTGPYNQTCISTTTNGGSKISSYAYGGATSPGITFDINGSVQGFPTVTLPVTNDDLACFNGTTGDLKDCSSSISGLTVTNHAVAIGTGALSFRSASPSTAGQALVSNGASSDPTFQTIGGSAFASQTANTVFAGPTTGAAAAPTFRALVGADLPNPSATTLGGVQSYAAVANQWIRSISTAGVPASSQPAFSDISGLISASQLPPSTLNGNRSAKSTSYSAVTGDCGSTLVLQGSAFYTLTLTAFSNYATSCQIAVYNADTNAAKTMAVTGLSNKLLWPGQTIVFQSNNATWTILSDPGRWAIPGLTTIYVDPVAGNNNNDGLATGTGRAMATISAVYSRVQQLFDGNGAAITIQVSTATPPITFSENLAGFGSLSGISGLTITGDLTTPDNYTWSYGAGTGAFARDFLWLSIGGFKMTGSGVALSSSQGGVIDFHDLDFAGSGYHIFLDAGGQMTPTGNYSISSTAYTTHWYAQKGGAMGVPAITIDVAAATFTNFVQIEGGQIVLDGAITFTGAGAGAGSTGNKYSVNGSGSNLFLNSVTLPGATAGSVTVGGTTRAPNTSSAGVSNVDATVPGGFSVSGVPITTTGTIAITANGTSGGVLCYTASNTMASSSALAANGIVIGGGGGVCPATTAAMTDGQLLVGQTSAAPLPKTITGDVTFAASGATTIGANKVANSQLAQMTNGTTKCRSTAGTGNAEDCTATQIRTIIEQGYVLLNVLTASSSATLSDTTSFTSDYDDYMFVYTNILPATDSVDFEMQVQSAASFQTTSYLNQAGGATTYLSFMQGANLKNTAANGGYSGIGTLHGVNGTTAYKFYVGRNSGYLNGAGNIIVPNVAGMWTGGTTSITGVQFLMSSGNIASGTIKIYGLRKAL